MSDNETVTGHLHAVSPMKMSKKHHKYFEATVQTGREEFNRVVCFSPEKRPEFVQAADNGLAVKLVGTRKTISKYWFSVLFERKKINGLSDACAAVNIRCLLVNESFLLLTEK